MFKTIMVFCICSIALSGLAYGSLLVGTKDLNYGFQIGPVWLGQVYLLKDINGNPLEYGGDFQSGGWRIKSAISQKDNLLDNSILLKGQWNGQREFLGQNLKLQFVGGYASLPSAFSVWSSFEARPAGALVLGGIIENQKQIGNYEQGTVWISGLRGQYYQGLGVPGGENDILFLSSLKFYNTFDYHFPALWGSVGRAAYTLDIYMADAIPFSALFNHGPLVGFTAKNWNFAYYYPLQESYLREKYPYQYKRFEIGAAFSLPAEIALDAAGVFQENNSIYSLMFSKYLLVDLAAGAYLSRDFVQSKFGVQFTMGENCFTALGNTFMDREQFATSQTATIQIAPDIPSPTATTLDELVTEINDPQKASWYAYNEIAYSAEHNGLAGMGGLYTPAQVFQSKQGNCLETANLQAYLLSRNGYQVALAEFAGRGTAHGILFYKDTVTGKWNAIENNVSTYAGPYVYVTNADTIEDALNMIYPDWYCYSIKDQNQAVQCQIDSTTKWYLNDWFDN
jgi:hypothetical protein